MSADFKEQMAPSGFPSGRPLPVPTLQTVPAASLESDGPERSDQVIRASEIRYRRLFESARDGILILDANTRKIMDANPFMTGLLGYQRGELVGRELWEIGLLKDEEVSQAMFRELQQSFYVRYEHLPLQSKTGERRDVEVVSNLYEEASKNVVQCNIRDITERKKIERRLALVDACIANLNDIVLVTEGDLIDEPGPRIVFVNEAFVRITGYTFSEAVGRSPRFLLGEKTDRHVLYEIRHALAQHLPIRRQIVNYRKDGTEVCLDMDIVPVLDEAGKVTNFAAIARDVSEEKKAEEQLLWRTAFFETQINSAIDGILIVGNAGEKIVQNQRLVELWGIPPAFAADIDHSRQLEWVTQQTRHPTLFAAKVAHLFAHPDETSTDEIELYNGKCFDRYSAPVRGQDGKHYGRIWSFRDVTDRKRDEAIIAEQASFLDKAHDAITVRSLDGKILFWNKGAEQMYGWTREEAMGSNAGALLNTFPEKFTEANALTISQGEWGGELQHHAKDRHEIVVEARWTLIRDAEGAPKAVLAINSDITEKKKVEAQFMRAQRMESIGTLAGGIAHDLNNILSPIMMSIDLLKLRANGRDADELLDIIKTSAQRGADIVRQVLSFARGMEGERVEIQIKHVLGDLQQIIKDTFPKDIRLQFSVPNDVWILSGDPTQIYQVLLNLCVNARDAMPGGGSLHVSVENCELDDHYAAMNILATPGRFVKIAVADSGEGIPRGVIDKIFDPFFTTKDLNKGTGLGLSTVQAVMKSHGGFINVYSEPGKGTVFNAYFPALACPSSAGEETVKDLRLPRGNGETILVVDDEAAILAITSQTLEAFGYRVLTATDGADGVAVYAQHRHEIAVVVTDMMMPVMGGEATIRALMRINPLVKVLAVSGLTANESTAKSSGAGVSHFLTKPYTAEALLTTIRQILSGDD